MSKLQYWVDLGYGGTPSKTTRFVSGGPGTGGKTLRLWDQLTLENDTFPGLCQIEATTKINFSTPTPKVPTSDPKNPTYNNYLLYLGWDPARITATLMIWDPYDWLAFQGVWDKFMPQKTTTLQQGLTISHPTTDFLGIDKVSIVGVNVPPITEQTLVVRLSMVQWYPPATLRSKFTNIGSDVVPPDGVASR